MFSQNTQAMDKFLGLKKAPAKSTAPQGSDTAADEDDDNNQAPVLNYIPWVSLSQANY